MRDQHELVFARDRRLVVAAKRCPPYAGTFVSLAIVAVTRRWGYLEWDFLNDWRYIASSLELPVISPTAGGHLFLCQT